jgi:hypothetical protein
VKGNIVMPKMRKNRRFFIIVYSQAVGPMLLPLAYVVDNEVLYMYVSILARVPLTLVPTFNLKNQ